MSSWRDQILKEFTPDVARLTLVADPDALLLEEGILERIRERGFELIPFEDHVAFRYAYESKFRSRWDRAEQTDLVVVLHSQAGELRELPYDLLQAGRKLSFNLGELFPNLSYPVVTSLDRGDLDSLYEAQSKHGPGSLGDNATKEFILRHVFGVAPELIKTASDLLRVLLRRHYRGQRIPLILDERLIQLLRQDRTFDDWPLEMLVPDREAFFQFLQERWPIYLNRKVSESEPEINEKAVGYGLSVRGPVDLPFDHDDIRIYIDNLFLEGLLQPVTHIHALALSRTWAGIGVRSDPSADRLSRIRRLIDSLKDAIPSPDARHGDWFHFSRGWAELSLLHEQRFEALPADTGDSVRKFQEDVDDRFQAWVLKRFPGLVNLPPDPPVMLHHLPRFLSRQVGELPTGKVAMLVLDGLALDQWLVIRDVLLPNQPDLVFREQNIFAWVPSLTSVSRQAAFAGRPPIYFPSSIQTTDKEPTLWKQFWSDEGLSAAEVVYLKGLGDGKLVQLAEILSHPKVRVAGLVVDKVDKIMHGMELGSAGMHNQVRQWAEQPYLRSLLELLLNEGFRVYLTSDHGNIEARGCGSPREGAVAELRGERARVYSDVSLRSRVTTKFPDAMEWPPAGIPEDYLPLLAPPRRAFVTDKKRTVCHGGISIEELIVPLIEIERKVQ